MGAIWSAFADMPRRFRAPFVDRLRRRNLLARVVEGYVGGLGAIFAFGLAYVFVDEWITAREVFVSLVSSWYLWAAATVAPLVEFVVYEFLLEPLGLTGHYWERGPRDNEQFTEE